MSKKLVLLALVALAALVVVTPALAAGNGQGYGGNGFAGHQLFSVLGTIENIGADAITVLVVDGSWAVKDAGYEAGDELIVGLTTDTFYYRWTSEGRVPITWEDLGLGDTVNIHGTVANGDFTAIRVTVDVPCAH